LNEAVEDMPSSHPVWSSGANKGITKVKYTHDAMIDIIIANPSISQNDLAANFGYSASWVSQIISSDAFQAKLAERKDEIVDPSIRASVNEKFAAMIVRSMAILMEKLDKPSHQIPDHLALRTLELSTRAAGYGAKEQPSTTVQVSMDVHLEALGGNLTNLLQRKKAEVIDIGEFDE
jgi:hypothetical protein